MVKRIAIPFLVLYFTNGYAQDSLSSPDLNPNLVDTSESVVADSEPIPIEGETVISSDTSDILTEESAPGSSSVSQLEPVPESIDPEPAQEQIVETPQASEELESTVTESLLDIFPTSITDEVFTKEALEESFFIYLEALDQEEAKAGGRIFGMLGSSEDIDHYKLGEYNRYLASYFPEAHSDIVQNFIINTHIFKSDWNEVTVALFKFLYIYPESINRDKIYQTAVDLFSNEKDYSDDSDKLLEQLNNLKANGENITDRYFAFLSAIQMIDNEDIQSIFNREVLEYLRLFPNSDQTSSIILWLGEDEYRKENYHTCFLYYKKILMMYPRSQDLAFALFNSGVIQSENFNEYDAAIATFREFLLRFSNDSLAASAQLNIATIADTKLENWVQAVEDYQLYADTYPTNADAAISLMRLGQIQADELNQPNEAISTYHYVVQLYPRQTDAIEALERCGRIYESDKKYSDAVLEYYKVYESYPDSENALTALNKCVTLYEKRLKDSAKTKEILTVIVEKYPESKSAKSAQKKLSKMK